MTGSSTPQALAQLSGTVLLAGAGKMGGALLAGWLKGGLAPAQVAVIEPHVVDDIAALCAKGLQLNPVSGDLAEIAALVIAVKPQMFGAVASQLRGFVKSGTLVVSIMAGIPIAGIAEACGGAVVRAMPNTPAAIGRGMTVAVAADAVSPAQRAIADGLLRATGAVEWIDDEALMDAVTAVSGSGPAYIFLLAEELAEAGIKAGLPPALARTLARETVAGAGELLYRSDLDPAVLRQNVTSPGGTTAAALEVLMGPDGLRAPMTRAIAAATRRSRELAK